MAPTPSSSSTELVRHPGRGIGFSLFGVPVRVASSFWFIAILFGTQGVGRSTSSERAVLEALIWTAVVFISILIHEFGHATAARAFGADPSITLHALGGLTQFEPRGMSRPQRWLVSFAGPAAGLLFGAAVYKGAEWLPPSGPSASALVGTILQVNIGWSLINLIPVLPFDGGQMVSAFLGPRRELWTAVISGVVGTAIAILGVVRNNLWVAFLFGSAAVAAIRQVRHLWNTKVDRDAGLDEELARARAAMAHGQVDEATKSALRIVEQARTSSLKNAGLLAQAWALASTGKRVEARETIERLQRDAPADAYLVAAVEDALGSPERARAWLEAERRQGIKRTESTKLLIDLYAKGGELNLAVDLAAESLDVLSEQDARAVLAVAVDGKTSVQAARLASAIDRAYTQGPGDARVSSPVEVPPT